MNKLLKKAVLILGLSALGVTSVFAASTVPEVNTSITIENNAVLTDEIIITDSEGNTLPVYKVVDPEVIDALNKETRTTIYDYYENLNWSVGQGSTKKGSQVIIGKGEPLYVHDARWNSGVSIHLGITDGSNHYYSSLGSGSFNGKITAQATGTYQFYVKNNGYDGTINFKGWLDGYPARYRDELDSTELPEIESADGTNLTVYKATGSDYMN